MARVVINTGSAPNDPTAESVNSAFTKTNAMTTELFTAASLGAPSLVNLTGADTIRAAFLKVDTNYTTLYASLTPPSTRPDINEGSGTDDPAAESLFSAFTKINTMTADCYAMIGGPVVYGPVSTISPPVGAIMLAAGQGSAALQTLINSNPNGTTFGIAAGTHTWTGPVTPKTGNSFIGEYGAILDGTGWTFSDLTHAAFRAHNQDIDTVTIKNLVIRNMPFEGIRALAPQASGWVVESCEIHANRFGLQIGATMTVRKCSIHHNIGANPAAALYTDRGGAYRGYLANGPIIEDNEVAYNGPEQKLTGGTGAITRRNWFHHNYTDGIWYDADNLDSVIEDNVVEDHPRAGIFYEISGNCLIRNNIIRRNGLTGSSYGISISGSKNVEIYGNTLEGNFRGIRYLVDCLRIGGGVIPGGWDLRDNNTHDNTIRMPVGSGTQPAAMLQVVSCDATQTAAYTGGSKNLHFTNNTYYVPTLNGTWWYWNAYQNWTNWQALGHDTTGSHLQL